MLAVPDLSLPSGLMRLAAFTDGATGGNPAGVLIGEALPPVAEMQRIARAVGYSETVFAAPDRTEGADWQVRYFSPEAEVPFCGHATIALGAALAMREGPGRFGLRLQQGLISVEGRIEGDLHAATLQSPPTRSRPVAPEVLAEALALFGWTPAQLDARLPPAEAHAGADHLLLLLNDRATLAGMAYDFERGQALMRRHGWVTILAGVADSPQHFHTRNAFAYGGVVEDPATGAATAALAGYLRDRHWPHGGRLLVQQGVDMGQPSSLSAEITPEPGASIRVSGRVRTLG